MDEKTRDLLRLAAADEEEYQFLLSFYSSRGGKNDRELVTLMDHAWAELIAMRMSGNVPTFH